MKRITVKLKGASPISFSKPISSPKNTGEKHDVYEERTWRERLHVSMDGCVFIPPMAVKHCLVEVAKFLGETVPGKGKATFTKHYKAGTMVTDPVELYGPDGKRVRAKDVVGERLFVPSNGQSGGGTRVWKTFPFIPEGWTGMAEIILLDPTLSDTPGRVEEHLIHAGKFIGMGRFRPINNGFYGRFTIEDFSVGGDE